MSSALTLAGSTLSADVWHKLFSQPDGRDKILRLIQYVCKLLRNLDSSKSVTSSFDFISKATAIESALASARQANRLFKWTSVYSKGKPRALSLFRLSKEETLLFMTDLAMLSYYVIDNKAFLTKLGVIKGNKKQLSRHGARFWLIAIVSGLLLSSIKLHALIIRMRALGTAISQHRQLKQQEQRKLNLNSNDGDGTNDSITTNGPTQQQQQQQSENEINNQNEDREDVVRGREQHNDDDETETAKRELTKVYAIGRTRIITVVKQVCDLAVACNGSFDLSFNQGFVGLCGTISSAIGISQIWPHPNALS